MSDPADAFETWLLHRVADAVESREVSADLLTDLHAEIADASERPPDGQHTVAIQELAERFDHSVDTFQEWLAALERRPRVTREAFLRRFVEAWLEEQREGYATEEHEG